MTTSVSTTQFTKELLDLLTETFETVQGIYLDRGTSIFETLAEITAAEASIPVGGKCATIAAQVEHVNFYLNVLLRYIETGANERVDWGEIWRTISAVTPQEWAASQARLKATYARIRDLIQTYDQWDTPDSMGGAMGAVVHSAYHLGEIRQATCTVKA
jgi:hypothetical protein